MAAQLKLLDWASNISTCHGNGVWIISRTRRKWWPIVFNTCSLWLNGTAGAYTGSNITAINIKPATLNAQKRALIDHSIFFLPSFKSEITNYNFYVSQTMQLMERSILWLICPGCLQELRVSSHAAEKTSSFSSYNFYYSLIQHTITEAFKTMSNTNFL